MTILGWQKQFTIILKEFKYERSKENLAAQHLNQLSKKPFSLKTLQNLIKNRTVFVVGAGPSLSTSISTLKKYKKNTIIAADGATEALIKNKIRPDIVVTDLDGDKKSLKKIGKTKTVMLVHAHGDNIEKLSMISNFKNYIGTTEVKPFDKIQNFGGFTDGDRCVFLANHFNAAKIVLFGMDFGNQIGKYSKNKIPNRKIKLKKLRWGKKLLKWLATKTKSDLYTTSKPITGFKKITFKELEDIIIT